jgi:hypothetical protein
MSNRKNRRASLIKSIYYTMFLLCCHLTYYEGEAEANAASLLVSVVMIAASLIVCVWSELILGLPLMSRWLFITAGGSIAFMNYFLFVRKHGGSRFGDEFAKYSEPKQTLLYSVAVLAMIAILVGAGFSAFEYRHAHAFPS